MKSERPIAALLAALLTLASCGGGEGGDAPDPVGPRDQLGVIERGVFVTPPGGERADGQDGQPVAVGTGVETDATGFGEVEHGDGSITRLDVLTSIVVVELDGTTGGAIEVTQDNGRLWHRVDDEGVEEYTVEMPVGTAAVRGTAFVTDCVDGSCLVQVVEGGVEVTSSTGEQVVVGAGEQVRIEPDGTLGPIEPLPPGFFDDPFVAANLERDEAAGFAATDEDEGPDAGGEAVALPEPRPEPVDSTGRTIEPGTIVAIDGGEQFAIVHQDGAVAPLPTGTTDPRSPRWSPDGQLIVFSADGAGDLPDLFAIRPDGTDLTQVTSTADIGEQQPVFNAAGTALLHRGNNADLDILDLTTGARRSVVSGTTFPGSFDWAWTGEQLIAWVEGSEMIWATDQGQEVGRWDHGAANAQWLRWLPDGFGVAFQTNSADASQQLSRVVETGGGNPFQLEPRFIQPDVLDQQNYVLRRSGALFRATVNVQDETLIAQGEFNQPDAWVPPQN